MQEEPRPFALVNPNREGQEEGGQTYSYAYGQDRRRTPLVAAAPAVAIGAESATLTATVNPNGVEVSECIFEYGTSAAYGLTAPCSPAPGAGAGPVAVSASVAAS